MTWDTWGFPQLHWLFNPFSPAPPYPRHYDEEEGSIHNQGGPLSEHHAGSLSA